MKYYIKLMLAVWFSFLAVCSGCETPKVVCNVEGIVSEAFVKQHHLLVYDSGKIAIVPDSELQNYFILINKTLPSCIKGSQFKKTRLQSGEDVKSPWTKQYLFKCSSPFKPISELEKMIKSRGWYVAPDEEDRVNCDFKHIFFILGDSNNNNLTRIENIILKLNGQVINCTLTQTGWLLYDPEDYKK